MATASAINSEDEAEIIDEFTVPGEQKVHLKDSQPRIQSLFQVQFRVLPPPLDNFHQEHDRDSKVPKRIWVQLKGKKEAVCKAKEYIKGSSEPEIEAKESYPKEMHCIFAGACSLFLDRLIRDTCATITVLEIGVLGIKGGKESFAMAQSKVQQLVKMFTDNRSLPPNKEPQVKRDFKGFVEGHADKYTMDLLLLPSMLKEELLTLVASDQFPSAQDDCDFEVTTANSQGSSHSQEEEARTNQHTPVAELMSLLDSVFPGDNSKPTSSTAQQERLKSKRRGSEKESACRKKPFSLDEIQADGVSPKSPSSSSIPIIDLISSDKEESEIIVLEDEPMSKEMEYKILVNFFKSMGYRQDVVEEVIVNLGQTQEPMKLFEEIKKRSDLPISPNPQKEIPERSRKSEVICLSRTVAPPKPEVSMAPGMIPGPSENRLLPESSLKTPSQESTSERLDSEKKILSYSFVARGASSPPTNKCVLNSEAPRPLNQPDFMCVERIPLSSNHENAPVLPSSADKSTPLGIQASFRPPLHGKYPAVPSSSAEKRTAPESQACSEPPAGKRMPFWNQACPELPVTGVQRFLNSIKIPYKLELKNEPGREDLKHIIIDGSNVAMSHGLQHFFSCRGIAIAVEYFWSNGHRKITVFVPQWRTKRDPRTTEQHFLQQLEELGLLSFTPARTVLGSHIASHDDRFLLHLAEKTGGIIVTNDNLREFVLETQAWKRIIKERLLQYTFVGDIFMPPDDPLGRYGPKLEDFLSTRNPPVAPPTDSGVFFSSQDAFIPQRAVNPALPRFVPPINPTILNVPRPRADVNPALPRFVPPINPTILNVPRPRADVPSKRSHFETISLRDSLLQIFPETEQREKINQILNDHPYMRDLNALSAMILD